MKVLLVVAGVRDRAPLLGTRGGDHLPASPGQPSRYGHVFSSVWAGGCCEWVEERTFSFLCIPIANASECKLEWRTVSG